MFAQEPSGDEEENLVEMKKKNLVEKKNLVKKKNLVEMKKKNLVE